MAGTISCVENQSARSYFRVYRFNRRTPDLLSRIRRWSELSRQRRELARLSDEMLKDIGISRIDALREARRPFWDDPKCRD
ncbi:MAG: DUF1127 domain-containing protein [Gammaproteobacteria bacterium]|nr:DUF1127 domain-containing protein [Gammaproteobacteria bacterium]MCP5409623.1 DUF1127 domain-containing protein [Chromatiaceae bacterium]MCP5441497.1 DUF1127 domain-containing protein [Chromatiaceae bacterium]